ncbi:MAG: MBL fold metallo-hydrolase [Candidatus Thermoplasmatota archaeon]|nr:MBL fold metallo-hydrolase [Candidatus Thermoplasmatota archaeon]
MHVTKIPGIGLDSNIYFIKDEESALIDAGTGFNSHTVIGKIGEEIQLKEISAIILTHEHFDHYGGIFHLKKYCSAKVMIHERGAEIIERGSDQSAAFFGVKPPKIKAHRKLKDGDIIKIGTKRLKVIHTPGHSPGGICLYEEGSKSLFSGDTIFSDGGVGRTDFFGGDTKKLVNSIKKLIDMDVANLYPGHGPHIIGNGAKHVRMALRTAEYMLGS